MQYFSCGLTSDLYNLSIININVDFKHISIANSNNNNNINNI